MCISRVSCGDRCSDFEPSKEQFLCCQQWGTLTMEFTVTFRSCQSSQLLASLWDWQLCLVTLSNWVTVFTLAPCGPGSLSWEPLMVTPALLYKDMRAVRRFASLIQETLQRNQQGLLASLKPLDNRDVWMLAAKGAGAAVSQFFVFSFSISGSAGHADKTPSFLPLCMASAGCWL